MGAGDFLKTIGKVAFPFISTAAMAGGPFTAMAAKAVGAALHIDKPGETSDDLATTMATAMADPATRAQLVQAEHDFQLHMAELNVKDIETLEDIAARDRADARNRQIQIRDRTPEIGFYLLLALFITALVCLFRYPVPAENKAVIFSMVGTLGTLTVTAATFFYGTTRDSGRKTELLAQAPAVK